MRDKDMNEVKWKIFRPEKQQEEEANGMCRHSKKSVHNNLLFAFFVTFNFIYDRKMFSDYSWKFSIYLLLLCVCVWPTIWW